MSRRRKVHGQQRFLAVHVQHGVESPRLQKGIPPDHHRTSQKAQNRRPGRIIRYADASLGHRPANRILHQLRPHKNTSRNQSRFRVRPQHPRRRRQRSRFPPRIIIRKSYKRRTGPLHSRIPRSRPNIGAKPQDINPGILIRPPIIRAVVNKNDGSQMPGNSLPQPLPPIPGSHHHSHIIGLNTPTAAGLRGPTSTPTHRRNINPHPHGAARTHIRNVEAVTRRNPQEELTTHRFPSWSRCANVSGTGLLRLNSHLAEADARPAVPSLPQPHVLAQPPFTSAAANLHAVAAHPRAAATHPSPRATAAHPAPLPLTCVPLPLTPSPRAAHPRAAAAHALAVCRSSACRCRCRSRPRRVPLIRVPLPLIREPVPSTPSEAAVNPRYNRFTAATASPPRGPRPLRRHPQRWRPARTADGAPRTTAKPRRPRWPRRPLPPPPMRERGPHGRRCVRTIRQQALRPPSATRTAEG